LTHTVLRYLTTLVVYIGGDVVKLHTKFEQNRTIRGRVVAI